MTVYLRVCLTFSSGFVHFYMDFMTFWSLKPALRAFEVAALEDFLLDFAATLQRASKVPPGALVGMVSRVPPE